MWLMKSLRTSSNARTVSSMTDTLATINGTETDSDTIHLQQKQRKGSATGQKEEKNDRQRDWAVCPADRNNRDAGWL